MAFCKGYMTGLLSTAEAGMRYITLKKKTTCKLALLKLAKRSKRSAIGHCDRPDIDRAVIHQCLFFIFANVKW